MGRRLGQHFLSDRGILDRIITALDPRPDDVVIEIGPGKGSLTRRLAPRVGTVIAIERDEVLVRELRGSVSPEPTALPPNVSVVHGDALQLDWAAVLSSELSVPSSRLPAFKLAGNIPYYITSPLIDKALTPPRASVTVFLMQREVADRLAAAPGGRAYGAISVGVRSVARVERLFTVKPGSFRPPPKVDSAVVRFVPLENPLVADEGLAGFRRFVTGLFAQRRKQLGRSLRSAGGLDKTDAADLLAATGIDPAARPEDLAPEDLSRLYYALPG